MQTVYDMYCIDVIVLIIVYVFADFHHGTEEDGESDISNVV